LSKKNPASAGKGCSSDPKPHRFSPKIARFRDFFVKLSTQFPSRAFWAIIEANKSFFFVSDPGVSLYGLLPHEKRKKPNKEEGGDEEEEKGDVASVELK